MNRNERGCDVDPYVYPSTHVFRNKASLREATVLTAHESRMVFKRVLQLYAEPCPGTLNVAHVSAIHHALFQYVYSRAGQFRTGNMSICGKTFCQAAMLETSLDLLLDQLAQEQRLAGLQTGQLTERAAFYLGELNTIHSFRNGNGRTQREFIRTLGLRAGHKVR